MAQIVRRSRKPRKTTRSKPKQAAIGWVVPKRRKKAILATKSVPLTVNDRISMLSPTNRAEYKRIVASGIKVRRGYSETHTFRRKGKFKFAGLNCRIDCICRVDGYGPSSYIGMKSDSIKTSDGHEVGMGLSYYKHLPESLALFLYEMTLQEPKLKQLVAEQREINKAHERGNYDPVRELNGIGCGFLEY